MAYFNELPNLEYTARFPNQSSNTDTVLVKNIFRRAKVRSDIVNTIGAFQSYTIIGDERPEQVAKKVYNDSELDWVVLTTNNIINVNEDWPIDNNSLHKYLIDKYGDEESIYKTHHYETIETRDEYNRLIEKGGLNIDDNINQSFRTIGIGTLGSNTYLIDYVPSPLLLTSIYINLNQYSSVYNRTDDEYTRYPITDIQINYSNLDVISRDSVGIAISMTNSLSDWPSTWGGSLTVYGRTEDTVTSIGDYVGDVGINIASDSRLYAIVGNEIDNTIEPRFVFKTL
jgi:hypothetical protein